MMIVGVAFFDRAAGLADEKLRQITIMIMVASDEGVQGFDAVDKAESGEKIESAVNSWRFRAATFRLQTVEQVIGFHSAAVFDDQFQDMFAQRREPLARSFAYLSCGVEPVFCCAVSHGG